MNSNRTLLLAAALLVLSVPAVIAATKTNAPYEIAFANLGPLNAEPFLGDAEGNNARPLLPHARFDGNASISSDGAWIVFTSEREGSFDIFRAHLDGSALERLVHDPAYDDQGSVVTRAEIAGFRLQPWRSGRHLDSRARDEKYAEPHEPSRG